MVISMDIYPGKYHFPGRYPVVPTALSKSNFSCKRAIPVKSTKQNAELTSMSDIICGYSLR